MKFNALVNGLGKIGEYKKYSFTLTCENTVPFFASTHSKTNQFVFKLKIEEIKKP